MSRTRESSVSRINNRRLVETDRRSSRFTAIWYSNAAVPYARHGIDPLDYFALAKAQRARGLLTRAVTGYTEGTNLRYAGFWSS